MYELGLHIGPRCGLTGIDAGSSGALRDAGVRLLSLDLRILLDGNFRPRHGDHTPLPELRASGLEVRRIEAPDELLMPGALREQEVESILRFCGAAGIGGMVLSAPGFFRPFAAETDFEALCNALGRLAACGRENGARLLLKNSPGDRYEKLARMVRTVDAAALVLCLDTGNAHLSGSVPEQYFLAGGRLAGMSLGDHLRGDKARMQPGYGDIPWAGLGRLLEEHPGLLELYVDAPFAGAATVGTVMDEVRALLEGRVYTSPAGGVIGKDPFTGRLMIRYSKSKR